MPAATWRSINQLQTLDQDIIYLVTYTKTPYEFKDALTNAPQLEPCRLTLKQAGYSWLMDNKEASYCGVGFPGSGANKMR